MRVVARPPVVFGGSPFRPVPSVKEQALKSGVQRAFAYLQNVAGDDFQMLSDAVAVFRLCGECAENEEIQSAGKDVGCVSHHLSPNRCLSLTWSFWLLRSTRSSSGSGHC